MTKAVPEVVVRGYEEGVKETYRRLRQVMPPYFFRSVASQEEWKDILSLVMDLEHKSGVQLIERPGRIVMAYLRSAACNPIETGRRFLKGKPVRYAALHESREPWNGADNLIIEQVLKELPGEEVAPRFTAAELTAEYRRLFGEVPEALTEAIGRVCWRDIADLNLERVARRLQLVLAGQSRESSAVALEKLGSREWRLTLAAPLEVIPECYYARILGQLAANGFRVTRSYLRDFTRAAEPKDFARKAMAMNTFYIVPEARGAATPKALKLLARELNELVWSPCFDLLETELLVRHEFCCASVNLMRAAAEFVYSQLSFVDRNAYTLAEIQRFMATYPAVLRTLIEAFEIKFTPGAVDAEKRAEAQFRRAAAMIERINSGLPEKDYKVRIVLTAVADFLRQVRRSNYYCDGKSALAFNVAPEFMRFYEALSEEYVQAFPPERPYGVFFFWRRDASGFHLRFADIARGGWRTVVPRPLANALESGDSFETARAELFRECFVLAHTQHRKNKDIYEGGAKLVTLLKRRDTEDFKTALWNAQRAIFEAFLSLLLYDADGKPADPAIVDYSGSPDIIEIGPDENMFDEMIEWMAERAVEEHYVLGSGIISGKGDTGINHKHYGVTSFGVHQYLLRTLQWLGIDPAADTFSVKLSGGPIGDVAGNEIKLLNAVDAAGNYRYPGLKIVAITDGTAAACDPDGLDRGELSRLVHSADLDQFNPKKLRGEGAYLIYNRACGPDGLFRIFRRQRGKLQELELSRDEGMRCFQSNICHTADVFLPCGGRPQTLNGDNWRNFVPGGKMSARAIVEGANSFLSPEARNVLQQNGLVIVKDASANKCGVITSSYEILSGLLLDPAEWAEVHEELVGQVMKRLELCAKREAEWLFREFAASGTPITDLSDELAQRMNRVTYEVADHLAAHPEWDTDAMVWEHLPPLFRERFPERLCRIPDTYRRAIAATEIASRLVFRPTWTLEEEVAGLLNATVAPRR